jgi:hypothetical protein
VFNLLLVVSIERVVTALLSLSTLYWLKSAQEGPGIS